MALSANTVWEVRQGGNDGNGGGFVTGASGTDRSQQDAAHATLTTASVVNSTTTIIDVDSGDYTCTDADVGNILQITGGTATAGYYEITARSGQQWTLDRSAGTAGQTVVGSMGGALATPGELTDAISVAGQKAWIKYNATAYLMTTTTAGSGGPCDLSVNMSNKRCVIEGYDVTRGDRTANKPTYDANAQTGISNGIFRGSGTYNERTHYFYNLRVDGQDGASTLGFNLTGAGAYSNSVVATDCEAVDCPTGFQLNGGTAVRCKASSCGTQGFNLNGAANAVWCVADLCADGFASSGASGSCLVHCIASDSTDDGFYFDGYSTHVYGCIAYSCAGDGFQWDGNAFGIGSIIACISTENTGYGWNFQSNGDDVIFCRNANYSNTAGKYNNEPNENNDAVDLTADPFVDAANGDFNINNTAGGGAALRAETTTVPT